MLLHVDLFVNAMDKMMHFYMDNVGLKLKDDAIISGDAVRFVSEGAYDSYHVVLLSAGKMGTMVELVEYIGEKKEEPKTVNNTTVLTFWVASISKKVEELLDKGIHAASGIFTVRLPETGRAKIVFYKDPENNLVEFLEML